MSIHNVVINGDTTGTINTDTLDGHNIEASLGNYVTIKSTDAKGTTTEHYGVLTHILSNCAVLPDINLATRNGGIFNLRHGTPDLRDLAYALAHINRFNGHFDQCSVAAHSIAVMSRLSDRPAHIRLYGLMHDAAEAYLGDIIRPIKVMLPDFDTWEQALLRRIWLVAAPGVDYPSAAERALVDAADDAALAVEMGAMACTTDEPLHPVYFWPPSGCAELWLRTVRDLAKEAANDHKTPVRISCPACAEADDIEIESVSIKMVSISPGPVRCDAHCRQCGTEFTVNENGEYS